MLSRSQRLRWSMVRVCAVVAAICTMTWVSESFSGSNLPPRSAYVSELFAQGQPWSMFLRVLDGIAGSATLIGIALAWGLLTPLRCTLGKWMRRWMTLIFIGLGIFGGATVLDATMPMSCTPSVSSVCAAAEAAGTVPWRHQVHTVSSSLATVGAMLAFVAIAVIAAKRARESEPQLRRKARAVVAWICAGAYLLTTVWVLVEIAGDTYASPLQDKVGFEMLGWSQRIQVSLSSISLLLTAVLSPRLTRKIHQ